VLRALPAPNDDLWAGRPKNCDTGTRARIRTAFSSVLMPNRRLPPRAMQTTLGVLYATARCHSPVPVGNYVTGRGGPCEQREQQNATAFPDPTAPRTGDHDVLRHTVNMLY